MRPLVVLAVAVIVLVTALSGSAHAQAAPALRLPWSTGNIHRINAGNGYGCDTHVGTNAFALDFDLSLGQQVASSAPGVVTIAGFDTNAGNYVAVDHGGGFTSRYLHLQTIVSGISQGVQVGRSQVVGAAGSTGQSTGPHLHFDLKLNGVASRPEPMSGVTGFGAYGLSVESGYVPPSLGCVEGNHVTSPYWDIDEFDNDDEAYFGTNAQDDCSNTTIIGDEAIDAWPWDYNDDKRANLSDVVTFGPSFNKPANTPDGRRHDMNRSGRVTLSDLVMIGPVWQKVC